MPPCASGTLSLMAKVYAPEFRKDKVSTLRLFLLTLLSSVLLPLALPNEFVAGAIGIFGHRPDESFYWGNALLGLVCIAPVFYAICSAPSFRTAARLGAVFGGISTSLSSFWLMFFQ